MGAAREYAQARSGQVSFAVRSEGKLYGWRAARSVPAASVLKAMLLVAYLRRPELREPLSPVHHRLLEPMVRWSDNATATRVRDIVGNGALARLARRAGMRGAPEGVLTAAALRCLGGEIQARFRYRNDEERARGAAMGHGDEDRVYTTEELASGETLVFAATGVTEGDLLQGVRFFGGGARTHSLVMGYQTKQVRFIDTVHMFDRTRPPAVRL